MRRRGLWLFILALVVTASTTWLNSLWTEQQQRIESSDTDKTSYYFRNFKLLSTDAEGNGEYHLSGRHLSHWQGQEQSEILRPNIVMFDRSDSSHTTVTAEKAHLYHKEEALELQNQVILKQRNTTGQVNATLSSEQLTYHYRKQQLETQTVFALETKDSLLTGKGLQAKLNEKHFKVLSNVRTNYQAQ